MPCSIARRAAASAASCAANGVDLREPLKPTWPADALIAADLYLAPNVGGDLAAQVTLDLVVDLDVIAKPYEFLVGQVLGALTGVDACRRQRRRRARAADPEDIGERDFHPLLAGKIDAD